MLSDNIVVLTDENFEEEVLQSETPVLVDFWAPWCPPCQMVSPIIAELAKKYEGKLKVGKMNVDENPQTPQKYAVMSIPTIVVFNKGEEAKRQVGFVGKEEYKKLIDSIFDS
jgi:thioredoxin 1